MQCRSCYVYGANWDPCTYRPPPPGLDPSIYFRHPTDVPPDELMGKTAPMTWYGADLPTPVSPTGTTTKDFNCLDHHDYVPRFVLPFSIVKQSGDGPRDSSLAAAGVGMTCCIPKT